MVRLGYKSYSGLFTYSIIGLIKVQVESNLLALKKRGTKL